MEWPTLVIPTYNRYNSIAHKTLAFLKSVDYPSDKITLFVSCADQEKLYSGVVPRELYGTIEIGVKGLMEQRNFITQFYPEDTILISMDDDVKKIDLPTMSFQGFVQMALERMRSHKGGLFGVLPNDDKRRYSNKTTTHLTHILGSFYIFRNHKDIVSHTSVKEDYERSILYFQKYGEVYRYRGGGVQTTYQKGKGGLNNSDRVKKEEEEVLYLLKTYPGYLKRKDKKGGTAPDVLLDWRATKRMY
jgi:hypothetical protein